MLAAAVIAAAAPLLVYAVRSAIAGWLVFPAPLLNPLPPTTDVETLARATRIAAGNATYHYYLAITLHDEQLRNWLAETGVDYGARAEIAAERAAELVPTNPYYRRLAGSIRLALGRQLSAEPDRARPYLAAGVNDMQRALGVAPRSNLVRQQVGVELAAAWSHLDAAGKSLTFEILAQATRSSPAFLTTALLHAMSARPDPSVLADLVAMTPADARSRFDLADFLRYQAMPTIESGGRDHGIARLALDEYRAAMELADLDAFYRNRWIEARRVLARNQAGEFARIAQEMVTEHPGRAEAELVLAAAMRDNGRDHERMTALDRAVALSEGGSARLRTEVFRRRGDARLERGDHAGALRDYETLAAVAPTSVDARLRAGNSLELLGRLDDAIAAYEIAARLEPRSAAAHAALASAYSQAGRLVDAIDEWTIASGIEPSAAEPLVRIARLYVELGQSVQAAQMYDRALALAPDDDALRQEARQVTGREPERP